jgi:predicted ATPase/DNA-binding SARP family transcriptional activator
VGPPGAATRSLYFGVLGITTVSSQEGEIEIHGAVRRRLLTRLLLSPNSPVSVDRLKEDLWDGEPPPGAASTLKSHVSLLRRSLGTGRLSSRGGGYVISLAPHELDALAFETESAAGWAQMRANDFSNAVKTFGAGLARWRGAALAEVADTVWGRPEAVRLGEMRAATTEAWLESRIILGESREVVPDAEAAVAESPLREGIWAKLIIALFLSGSQADALRAYQRLREMLGDELGISPSRELVMLEGAILRQDLDIAGVSERARGMTSRGNSQVMTEEIAAASSPAAGSPMLLRREQTSFVPRPAELAEILRLLEDPGLVTLAGPGGTGKTRLALRAARELVSRVDSVWVCELAPIEDAAEIPRALAAALGCADHPAADLSRTVAERAQEGENLLVIDNCEHLVDASARGLDALIGAAPALRVLVTSRSPLGVNGEQVHWVPAMSLPKSDSDLDELMNAESVRLFVERAASQQARFVLDSENQSAVAAICIRLDGVPLALELAAARLRSLSLDEIEQRLDDRFSLLTTGPRTLPERQRSLRALIDWSFDLLSAPERAVFRRLAVFANGFDLSGAEAVATNTTVEQHDVIDLVASLVDKSLLQVDTTGTTARYRMLETVRAYALDKLEVAEAESARAAHAAHFLRLVEKSAPHFSGRGESEWRARLEEDDENIRVALNHLVTEPAAGPESLRFAAAVSPYWNSRGIYGDDVDLLEASISHAGAAHPTADRGAALAAAGYMMFRRGGGARARQHLEEALAIADSTGSEGLRADALRTLAWIADRRGDREAAQSLAGEAVAAALRSGDNHLIARAYDVRAAATHDTLPEGARSDYAEALKYCRIAGDGLGQASALNNLAVLDLEQGDHGAARERLGMALEIAATVRDAALVPFLEYGLGLAACLEGDETVAGPAFSRALTAARRTGQRTLVAYAVLGLAASRAIGPAGQWQESALLLGASSALFEQLDEQPEALEAALAERTRAVLREALGDQFDRVLDEGGRTPVAQILEIAAATS